MMMKSPLTWEGPSGGPSGSDQDSDPSPGHKDLLRMTTARGTGGFSAHSSKERHHVWTQTVTRYFTEMLGVPDR